MAEYLAPGVYVEETSFRSKSIEGVSTSTTGFVGPTRRGPIGGTPELLTSIADFERIYGGIADLTLGSAKATNYLAHAVRAYFAEGGARLYVSRAYVAPTADEGAPAGLAAGCAWLTIADHITFVARSPGSGGNGKITVRRNLAPATVGAMRSAKPGTTVLVTTATGGRTTTAYYVKSANGAWTPTAAGADALSLDGLDAFARVADGSDFVTLTVETTDADGRTTVYEDLAVDGAHPRFIGSILNESPARRSEQLERVFAIRLDASATPALLLGNLLDPASRDPRLPREHKLTNGSDGAAPNAEAHRLALEGLAGVEDISIVAAPGSSTLADAKGIRSYLIAHAEASRAYRIAVLETPAAQTPTEARNYRGEIDSSRAALYYPWVVVSNPLAVPGADDVPKEIALPPSGFICGVYARTDIERAVWKAPANEVVRTALRFERDVSFGEQGLLNPIGVNCLRYLSGRGYRVWGARTATSDPEWKYVNIRRYFNYLERSIDVGTQWAVFEPNGERLWANIRETISSFLYNEWRSGALLGDDPKQAFFVRCDRSTMDQNDLDNGRLVCLVGVAAVKPAEFVIFRVGQKTADQHS